jgi:hypothetical protein
LYDCYFNFVDYVSLEKSADVFDIIGLKRRIEQRANEDDRGGKATKVAKNNNPGAQREKSGGEKKIKIATDVLIPDSFLLPEISIGNRMNTKNNTNSCILDDNFDEIIPEDEAIHCANVNNINGEIIPENDIDVDDENDDDDCF